jgi:hypothetical protein
VIKMGSSLNESIICYFPYLPKENGNKSEIDLLLFVNIYIFEQELQRLESWTSDAVPAEIPGISWTGDLRQMP